MGFKRKQETIGSVLERNYEKKLHMELLFKHQLSVKRKFEKQQNLIISQ